MRRLHLPAVTKFTVVTYHVVTCPHDVTIFTVIDSIAKVNHGLCFCCRFLMEGLWKEVVHTPQFR
jgi:hypothetical protein